GADRDVLAVADGQLETQVGQLLGGFGRLDRPAEFAAGIADGLRLAAWPAVLHAGREAEADAGLVLQGREHVELAAGLFERQRPWLAVAAAAEGERARLADGADLQRRRFVRLVAVAAWGRAPARRGQ